MFALLGLFLIAKMKLSYNKEKILIGHNNVKESLISLYSSTTSLVKITFFLFYKSNRQKLLLVVSFF